MKRKRVLRTGLLVSVCAVVLTGTLFIACTNQLLDTTAVCNGIDVRASSGKVGAPIPIESAADMALIGHDPDYPLDENYVLTADIVLSNWTPIGDKANPFTGTFTGTGTPNNHTIALTDFSVAALAGPYLGIFGYVASTETGSGTISNLNVQAKIVETSKRGEDQYVGLLVGYVGTGASISNVTVTGALVFITTGENTYLGGLAGYVSGATLGNINTGVLFDTTGKNDTTYIGGVTGYANGTTLNSITVTNATTLYVAGNITFYVGGVTGYLDSSSLIGGSSTAEIDGNSSMTIYAGGAVGYGRNTNPAKPTSISNYSTTGDVTITNGAVNTSAGGISGYTQGTAISNCHATGDITINFRGTAMVYAGGLSGYADTGTITASHAEGDVLALSNFPYAGGLVGYNYSGNVISQCYATGDVTAQGNTTVDNSYPYAGGLAGYNSGGPSGTAQSMSTIENCYATGNVTAQGAGYTAWAGGITGSNARYAIVSKSYSTGAVKAVSRANPPPQTPNNGAIVGGIVGYNQFGNAIIERSAALNSKITADAHFLDPIPDAIKMHRIEGSDDGVATVVLDDNIGSTAIVYDPDYTPFSSADGVDGADTAAQPAQTVYEGLGWSFGTGGVWIMGTGGYPLLQWQ